MSHARLERQLSAYLDNELTAGEAREVRAHLEQCALCREELERLRQTKQLLGRLPERSVPDDLWDSLSERLQEAEFSGYRSVRDVLRWVVRRPAVAVAAAALVIILIAFPLVKGRIDRLRAAEVGVDLFVREHAILSSVDPFTDPAYLGLLIGDASVALVGEPRPEAKEGR